MKIIDDQFPDLPHNRGQSSHHLIISKSDHPQPQRGQHLLPPFIFLFLQVVDIAIHFNNQPRPVAIEVNDESLNDLLPPKVDSQLIRPKFLPQEFLGGSHLTAQFFGTLKFLRGDFLIRDDVFDRHGMILPKKHPSPLWICI
jgi:hypothetical protein